MVNLTWSEPASRNVSFYVVARQDGAGLPYHIVFWGTTQPRYADTQVQNGTTYTYIVFAVNGVLFSPPSNTATATPRAPAAHLTLSADGTPLVSGAALSFGTTRQYEPVSKTLTLANTGDAGLTLTSLNLPVGFSATLSLPTTVPPSGSLAFTLTLNANAGGSFGGTASLLSNDAARSPFTLALSSVAYTRVSNFVRLGLLTSPWITARFPWIAVAPTALGTRCLRIA